MNILFITDNFPPEINPAGFRVAERAKHWAQEGHQVTILTSAPNFPQGKLHEGYKNAWYQKEEWEGMTVLRVKTFIVPNEGFILRTLDFLSFMVMAILVGSFVKDQDVVVATSPQFFSGYAGLALGKIKHRPFLLELGDLWPESIKGVGLLENSPVYKFLEKMELFMYRKATGIVAQTPAFKKNLVLRGIDSQKIDVVLNGVDTSFFKPQMQKALHLQDQLQLKGKRVVGYIGTHGMAHGLVHALDIAKKLEEKNVVFLFIGAGAEKKSLQDYQQKNSISNVLFIDSQKKSDIASWWSLCDVSLIHLKNDPVFASVIPSKIFESMAVAKPIFLVAPTGEASKIVNQYDVGFHCSAYDAEKDAISLLGLLNDSSRMEMLRQNMISCAPQFDRKIQAKAFLMALYKLCFPMLSSEE